MIDRQLEENSWIFSGLFSAFSVSLSATTTTTTTTEEEKQPLM